MSMWTAITGTVWKWCSEPRNAAESEAFASLERVFELSGMQVSAGRLCCAVRVSVEGRNYYVKRYHARGKHRRKALGRNRPVCEARNLAYFDRMGVPVPRVLACGSQRVLGLFRRGAIVTEEVPDTTDLRSLAGSHPELFRNRTWLLQLVDTVADYVRAIHEDGFIHRDLKWRNILVVPDGVPQVFFIDCPSGGHWPPLARERYVAKDLAHLDRLAPRHMSRTMRLRFLLRYRNHTSLTTEDRKLIKKVAAFRDRDEN